MNDTDLDEIGTIIDRACDKKDEEELKLIIAFNEDYVEREEKSVIKARLYYFLANAWAGLHNIKNKQSDNSIWNYEQEEINKQIIYLRKAKQEKGFPLLHEAYQLSILTNLANIFNHTGRTVYAMRLYNQALEINPDFFMALANRGICFQTYSGLDYDSGHKNIFIKLAYDDFKKAVDISKLYILDEYHSSVIKQCINNIQVLENYISEECLNSKLELDNFSLGKSKEEQRFRSWTLYNTLFLNPINDIGYKKIASHDPLGLPNLITNIKSDIPKYISYFNQIKQEFITYRHLLYEGTNYKTKKFYDKDTVIIDDLQLNLNDVNTEKIKLAFRGFYSIFDKIAYFLYEYFELDLKPNNIYFNNVWKMKNNRKEFNIKFNDFENLALRGLYFISKDLFFDKNNEDERLFIELVEPEAKKINEIRNHLEHKFIDIKMLDMKNTCKVEDTKIKNISLSELEEKALHLARLAREAIIYLSFAVHIEESKKDNTNLYPMILNVKKK
ncbi:MAG: LA2681 family HEPN domain-containing protein [Arcobacteraceae bacterium]|nr:LA2681 family HEPN domain-containing protein [Arcobacteraceae bacterium]